MMHTEGKTVVRMLFGSYLYGTNSDSSDKDFKEIRLPPPRDILLQRAFSTIHTQTKVEGQLKNTYKDVDTEIFSLQQYCKLLSQGQTVAMDMLFAPENMWVGDVDIIWKTIQIQRQMLLSRSSAAFVGYVKKQAAKYGIKGSRVAVVRAARDLFQALIDKSYPLAKIGEFEQAFQDFVNLHEHCGLIEKTFANQSNSVMHLRVCEKMVPFTNTLKSGLEIYSRLFDEYGQRALAAETNQGVDWKALSHAVRIAEQAIELFNTHTVTFPRPNAEYLRDIKLGRFTYKEVEEVIETLVPQVEEAAARSTLPDKINTDMLDTIVLSAYYGILR